MVGFGLTGEIVSGRLNIIVLIGYSSFDLWGFLHVSEIIGSLWERAALVIGAARAEKGRESTSLTLRSTIDATLNQRNQCKTR